MKTYLSFFCVLTSLSSLLCAACVKTPTITEINFEASYEGLHNENILVIGATTKRTSRNLLEGKLTKELQDQGLKPLPSYDNRPYSNILPRETVLNAAENSGIEGIFFISLIETDKKDNFDSGNKPDPYVYYENIQKLVTGSKETSTQEEQFFSLHPVSTMQNQRNRSGHLRLNLTSNIQ